MRSLFTIALLLVATTQLAAAPIHCGVRSQAVIVQKQQAFIAVPFAVPVAQPVAVFSYPPVLYGAGPGMFQTQQMPSAASEPLVTDLAGTGEQQEALTITQAESWVTKTCLKCHNATKTEGGLDLSDLSTLPDAKRLAAIKRVVSDDPAVRMPPNSELEPAALGGLVQEFSATKEGE